MIPHMTPRERWLAVLDHKVPDRIPTDYWGTGEITTKLKAHLGVQTNRELWERLHIDAVHHVSATYIGPPLRASEDVWGVTYRDVSYSDGSGVYAEVATHPLGDLQSIDEIEDRFRWPDPEWWDYSAIPAQIEAIGDYPRRGGGSEPFLTYCSLRGMEQAYMDLIINPDIAHHCINKLYDLAYRQTARILEAGNGEIDMIYVAEDMGSQSSLLFSPHQIQEFFVPGFTRMIELGTSAGARAFHHSDGSVREIIPTMVDLGIAVLNPIQWRCDGVDRAELKATFGDRLVFHGAMDNQETLPFGTVDDVVAEVRDNIRLLGDGGGYVLAPCHNLQSNTPVENIVAMYETAYLE
ncbi:MAG: uroporphyrinogen-III decarboxylase-like protein, partial [Spirochaetales bacterium]